jgi:predicted DNA-binding protein with PD1-like motif
MIIMNTSSLSRRHWIGSALAACGSIAAGGLARAETAPVPEGYTRPGPVTERGLAPGLQAKVIHQGPNGETTYAVIFAKGDEILSGLTEFAEARELTVGYFSAIGALQRVQFGWFDSAKKAYRNIPIQQQVELISLIGNVGLVDGKPQIHAHGAVGFSDGQVRGGHLLQALVWPTLELFFTTIPATLIKKHDPETDLALFDLKATS